MQVLFTLWVEGLVLADEGAGEEPKLDDEGAIVDETLKDTAGTQAYRAPSRS